ncbi:hypothetical protein ABW20_dc0109034 [Dactylellina cionopaga]|nr:hypothetical protein ABW20_dc0109034 [Dactylellina cionopaga]
MEPGWTEYTTRVLYQTYNITEHLQQGENDIAVYVADGWYRGRLALNYKIIKARRGIFGNETGFMAVMDTYGPGGSQETFWTGATNITGWKCTKTTPILDSGIYDGEFYDSRVDFNVVDGQNQGDYGWKDVKTITHAFAPESSQALQASIAPPIRHTQSFAVKEYLKSPDGKTILDFGQNIAGRVRIRGSAPAGAKITLVHVELLEADGTPCISILREAKVTDNYIFNGSGIEEWEPDFTYHGFRYVQVDPWIEGLEFEARVYGNDLPKGLMKFESTHPELNRLVENIIWSTKANFFAVPTDCPQRDERLGWAGDINLFAPTAVYVFDCQTFLKSWLLGVQDGQNLGGVNRPPVISPNAFENFYAYRPMAVWEDVIVTLPWTLYQTYRDTSILSELFPSMVDYVSKGIPRITEGEHEGMWADGFQYGDWLNPSAPPDFPAEGATNSLFVANTWLCHITTTMAKIATVLGKQDEAKEWNLKASVQISKWQARYLVPLNSSHSGVKDEPPKLITEDTQTAYSVALNFHLLPEEYIEPAIARLHYLVRQEDYHPTTGLVGTPEVLHAICYPRTVSSSNLEAKLKSVALAYKLLLGRRDCPSWLYPITLGATSIWERWDSIKPDGTVNAAWMTSLNHYALGSAGRWIFETIGGIAMVHDEDSKGSFSASWKIVFDPIPNVEHGVTRSEMVFESPKGTVECKWKYDQEEKVLSIEVALPANCEGEIRVLGKTTKTVSGGRWNVSSKLEEAEWKLLEAGEGGN